MSAAFERKVKLKTVPNISLKLPIIGNTETPEAQRDHSKLNAKDHNPFQMPSNQEIFEIRAKNRLQKNQERKKSSSLKIYQRKSGQRSLKTLLGEDQDDIEFYNAIKKRHADKVLMGSQTRADSFIGKENLQDFVSKKREMFLVHYALSVKRDEMKKLEYIVKREEQKIMDEEKELEAEAAKFETFLKENDNNSVEAIKKAEIETKSKLEKIQEIKKLNVQISGVKAEMGKNEEQFRDLQQYRKFLENLTPADFLAVKGKPEEHGDDDDFISTDEPVIYFKRPSQLLDIFAELEENNLALIQSCQETEEGWEELKFKVVETNAKMEAEMIGLNMQIEQLNASIAKEEEKEKMLEARFRLFSSGLVGRGSQDKIMEDLNHKVKEVYRRCLGDDDGDLSPLQMLSAIENKLEQIFEAIELMSPEKVEEAGKKKDKERRQRLREEKLAAQRLLQEERIQRALERAKAPVQKKREPKMIRSNFTPLKLSKKHREKETNIEDNDYFFV